MHPPKLLDGYGIITFHFGSTWVLTISDESINYQIFVRKLFKPKYIEYNKKPKTRSINTNNILTDISSKNKEVFAEKVFYGKVIMYRTSCPKCGEMVFMDNLHFKCTDCNHEFFGTIDSMRIEVNVVKRKYPNKKLKETILNQQSNSCYWCFRGFGFTYFRHNAIRTLLPNWDHAIPLSFSQSNADDNFVASCSICNGFKSSHVFESDRACRAYIEKRWDKHIRLRKIVFLEEDFAETEKSCKNIL